MSVCEDILAALAPLVAPLVMLLPKPVAPLSIADVGVAPVNHPLDDSSDFCREGGSDEETTPAWIS